MILDISSSAFKNIFNDNQLFLPIRWDGINYSETLEKLFNKYISRLEKAVYNEDVKHIDYADLDEIKNIINILIDSINHYLNGFPSKAYETFRKAMQVLMYEPLKVYQKSATELFDDQYYKQHDSLRLFRATKVYDNQLYKRTRVFHTPYNLRAKVSSCRYSIAGYPSLYLSTSLNLCCNEIQSDPNKDLIIAAAFKLERSIESSHTNIEVIELGIKPQDFLNIRLESDSSIRHISKDFLNTQHVKSAYLFWYPLIAACSFIRTNKKDPFAVEYIIPQLLMQWVRSEIDTKSFGDCTNLIGIRYFSCASEKASDMGFNYVFPTSGQPKSAEIPYCAVLAKSFRLTNPVYIHEFDSVTACERKLRNYNDFDYIFT